MKNKNIANIIAIILAIVPFSSVAERATNPHSNIVDDPDNGRFLFTFENQSKRKICLSSVTWPNENGFIAESDVDIFVTIDGQKFPLDTFNEECSACNISVSPKGNIKSYLSYDAFKIPRNLYKHQKDINIPIFYSRCR